MDKVLKNALAERRRLQAELARVEAFLEDARKYNGGTLPKEDEDESAYLSYSGALQFIQRRRHSSEDVVKAAIEVMREVGRPMTRFELADALYQKNVEIGGNDKAKNLGTMLWRSPNVVNNGDGYWPKDESKADSRKFRLPKKT